MPIRYSVVIPAWNEERTIAPAIFETESVFDALSDPYEIIVVDDGSKDLTASIVQRLQDTRDCLRLIRHEQNQGKGKAVQTGVAQATGDFLLYLDADLSTHPKEFAQAIPYLHQKNIIIASRTVRGSTIPVCQPWHRVLAGKLMNWFIRTRLKLPFHDTQCGFKVFPRSAKPFFKNLQTRTWLFDAELLYAARKQNFHIQEMPIEWNHRSRSRVCFRDGKTVWKDLNRIASS